MSVQSVVVRLLAIDEMSQGLDRAGSNAVVAATRIEAAGGRINKAFGGMGAAALHAAGILGAFEIGKSLIEAGKEAIHFQQAMERVHTQAGASQSEVDKLTPKILGLSKALGASPTELATSLYHAESVLSGMGTSAERTTKALDLVTNATKLAKVGNADLEQTTNAMTAVMAGNFAEVGKSAEKAAGAINAIVGSGDMSTEDLNSALSTGIIKVSQSYGVSLTEIGGALATFGDHNIRGARAAEKLRLTIQDLVQPGARATEVLGRIGLSSKEVTRSFEEHGLNKTLLLLRDHLRSSGIAASQWGEIVTAAFTKKAGAGLTVMLSDLDRDLAKTAEVGKRMNSFPEAWQKFTQTAGFQLSKLGQTIKVGLISSINDVLPTITGLAHTLVSTLTPAFHGLGAVFHLISGPLLTVGPIMLTVWAAAKGFTVLNAARAAMWNFGKGSIESLKMLTPAAREAQLALAQLGVTSIESALESQMATTGSIKAQIADLQMYREQIVAGDAEAQAIYKRTISRLNGQVAASKAVSKSLVADLLAQQTEADVAAAKASSIFKRRQQLYADTLLLTEKDALAVKEAETVKAQAWLTTIQVQAGVAREFGLLTDQEIMSNVARADSALAAARIEQRAQQMRVDAAVKASAQVKAANASGGGMMGGKGGGLLMGGMMLSSMIPGSSTPGSAGSAIGGTITGAATGAMIGSMIAPGIGTAIGGALGGAIGFGKSLWDGHNAAADAAKKKAQDYDQAVSQLAGTMRDAGKATEQTTAALAAQFDKTTSGALAAAAMGTGQLLNQQSFLTAVQGRGKDRELWNMMLGVGAYQQNGGPTKGTPTVNVSSGLSMSGYNGDAVVGSERISATGTSAPAMWGRLKTLLNKKDYDSLLKTYQDEQKQYADAKAIRLAAAQAAGYTDANGKDLVGTLDSVSAKLGTSNDQVAKYGALIGQTANADGYFTKSLADVARQIKVVQTAFQSGDQTTQNYLNALSTFQQSAGATTSLDRANFMGATMKAMSGDALNYATSMAQASDAVRNFGQSIDQASTQDARFSGIKNYMARNKAYLDTIIQANGHINTRAAGASALLGGLNSVQDAGITAAQQTFLHESGAGTSAKKAATDAYNTYMSTVRPALQDQLRQLGIVGPKADKLLGTYLKTPKELKTTIQAIGTDKVAAVLDKIGKLLAAAFKLPWNAEVKTNAPKVSATVKAEADKVRAYLKAHPGTVLVDPSKAKGKINEAGAHWVTIGKTKFAIIPKLDANTAAAVTNVDAVVTALGNVKSKTITVTVNTITNGVGANTGNPQTAAGGSVGTGWNQDDPNLAALQDIYDRAHHLGKYAPATVNPGDYWATHGSQIPGAGTHPTAPPGGGGSGHGSSGNSGIGNQTTPLTAAQQAKNEQAASAAAEAAAKKKQALADAVSALGNEFSTFLDSVKNGTVSSARSAFRTLMADAKKAGMDVSGLRQNEAAVLDAMRRQATAQKQLATAQNYLNGLVQKEHDLRNQVSSAITGSFNIASSGHPKVVWHDDPTGGKVTIGSILKELRQKVGAAGRFRSLLHKLQAEGLNPTLIAQLAEAGPDALPEAEALAHATPAQIRQVNSGYRSLTHIGASLGKSVSEGLYGARIDVAKALLNGYSPNDSHMKHAVSQLATKLYGSGKYVGQGFAKGLRAVTKDVAAAATSLATTIINAIKNTLGIHSPSKVATDLGQFVGDGFAIGLTNRDQTVLAHAKKLADAATTGLTTHHETLNRHAVHLTDRAHAINLAHRVNTAHKTHAKNKLAEIAHMHTSHTGNLGEVGDRPGESHAQAQHRRMEENRLHLERQHRERELEHRRKLELEREHERKRHEGGSAGAKRKEHTTINLYGVREEAVPHEVSRHLEIARRRRV